MPARVVLGPYTELVACLQLAWRKPDLSAVQKQIIEEIARPLQGLFDPPFSDSLELGWNTDYDVDPKQASS